MVEVDVLIVGAGPVGLYGAYYAGVRGLRVAVIDSLSEAGGQVAALYPEKLIFDVAGLPAVKGRDLIADLITQAAPFEPVYLFNQEAQALHPIAGEWDVSDGHLADAFSVETSAGTSVRCGAVVVTSGIGTFTPRPLAAGEQFLGRGLSYFVPDPSIYADADVVIVGGGDSALDWALMLESIAKSIVLVHRREAFRAHASTVAAVRASSVHLITNAQVTEVHGNDKLEGVTLSVSGENGGTQEFVSSDAVIAALGFTANLGPLRDWGMELHHNRHVVVDSAMRTSVQGVFAAGDITQYDGKVRLISVGFGEVATAVNNAAVYIDPEAALFPGHSTDADVHAIPTPALTPSQA